MGCYSSRSVFERILDNISLLQQGSYLLNTYENDPPGRVNLLPSSLPGKESWLVSSRGSAFQELGYHDIRSQPHEVTFITGAMWANI